MPKVNESAIELDLSKLDKRLEDFQSLDPRYMDKAATVCPYEYKPGASSLSYDQFKDLPRSGAIVQINRDLNGNIDSKIVLDGKVLNLKEEVEKFVTEQELKLVKEDATGFLEKFNYKAVKYYLSEKHKLSEHQCNFILASFHQGALAATVVPIYKLLYELPNETPKLPLVANSSDFVVEISQGKCSMAICKNIHLLENNENAKSLREKENDNYFVGGFIKENANLVTTPDSMIANVRVELGVPGESKDPKTTVQLFANGDDCKKIIDKIKSTASLAFKEIQPKSVKKNLDEFETRVLGKEKCDDVKKNILKDLEKYQKDPKTSFDCQLMDMRFRVLQKLKEKPERKNQITNKDVIILPKKFMPEEELLPSSLAKKFKDKDLDTNESRQALAVDLAAELKDYYSEFTKGYLERFSKKIVNALAEKQGLEVKQGFFSRMSSKFKDMVHGYKENRVPQGLKDIRENLTTSLPSQNIPQSILKTETTEIVSLPNSEEISVQQHLKKIRGDLEKDKKIQGCNSKFPQKKKIEKAKDDISVGVLKAGKARERFESPDNPNSPQPPQRLRSKSLDISKKSIKNQSKI